MTYKTSSNAISAICDFEGLKLKAYKCPAGVWTIGVGHTQGVKKGDKITVDQAMTYLQRDISPIEKYLNQLNICKTQGQFDALVDFIFNLGVTNFKNSTLYKCILANSSNESICKQFMRWVYAGGKKLPGLVRRRAWECEMWNSVITLK